MPVKVRQDPVIIFLEIKQSNIRNKFHLPTIQSINGNQESAHYIQCST